MFDVWGGILHFVYCTIDPFFFFLNFFGGEKMVQLEALKYEDDEKFYKTRIHPCPCDGGIEIYTAQFLLKDRANDK